MGPKFSVVSEVVEALSEAAEGLLDWASENDLDTRDVETLRRLYPKLRRRSVRVVRGSS